MYNFRQFMARYQTAVFVFLAYLLSWAFVIPAQGGLIPHGPLIAALIVLGVVAGRQGVSGLGRQMARWRVGWMWYLVVPGIFLAAHLVSLALNLALGAQITSTAQLGSLTAILGVVLPLVFLGGQWEEPGWTGYLLGRFTERFPASPLAVALATGVVRMFWHIPLLLYGKIPWYDFLFYSFALQIILTWLYHRTRGSVLIVMLGHLFSNVLLAVFHPMFGGPDQGQYWTLMVLFASVVALGLVIATRGTLGQHSALSPSALGRAQQSAMND